jgi:hypothetical protein
MNEAYYYYPCFPSACIIALLQATNYIANCKTTIIIPKSRISLHVNDEWMIDSLEDVLFIFDVVDLLEADDVGQGQHLQR